MIIFQEIYTVLSAIFQVNFAKLVTPFDSRPPFILNLSFLTGVAEILHTFVLLSYQLVSQLKRIIYTASCAASKSAVHKIT